MKIEKRGGQRESRGSCAVQAGRLLSHAVRFEPLPGLSSHLWRAVCAGLLILTFCPLGSRAQGPKPVTRKPEAKAENVPASPATAHEMTADDVSAFLDGLMPQQLERENIAGAVISIVKDGKVLFAKGYGYSDVKQKTPVSPDNTLFRPGSISKLFTWTSVMQLVEAGKLDLDRDVNDYLDFKIPTTYPQADHSAEYHDAHARIRRGRAGIVRSRCERLDSAWSLLKRALAGTDLSARHNSRLLELCDGDGGIHRAARLRRRLFRLH